jgi:hypothetical protein
MLTGALGLPSVTAAPWRTNPREPEGLSTSTISAAAIVFRQAEFERMIEHEPTASDKRHHKTWLATLIAEGERLLTEIRTHGGLTRNQAGIKISDIAATVEELQDTQAEWYGVTSERRAELLKQVFDVSKS